ncbi:MAG: NAD-dependent epimerase/dehydratase family protein [Opitutales bacterium]
MATKRELPWKEEGIDRFFGRPTEGALETMRNIEGDVALLGVGGKMGPTMASMLRQGFDRLGKKNRIFGVSRFSNPRMIELLESFGVEIVRCDLLNRDEVARLPEASNVVTMSAFKFGAASAPEMAWAMNTIVPVYIAERFPAARIVVFSTGCVYSFSSAQEGGSREDSPMEPPGDYANSCIGRERVFTHFSKKHKTPVAIFRLNYAIDLRYGVLVDIAQKVLHGEPVDVGMGYVNIIGQGDAVARAIQCFDHTDCPPFVINVTGPEVLRVRDLAQEFGERFGVELKITGEEEPNALLSNARKSMELFGPLTVDAGTMIEWVACYMKDGGELLGKPTHFETRSGKF